MVLILCRYANDLEQEVPAVAAGIDANPALVEEQSHIANIKEISSVPVNTDDDNSNQPPPLHTLHPITAQYIQPLSSDSNQRHSEFSAQIQRPLMYFLQDQHHTETCKARIIQIFAEEPEYFCTFYIGRGAYNPEIKEVKQWLKWCLYEKQWFTETELSAAMRGKHPGSHCVKSDVLKRLACQEDYYHPG
jgi:hypothetical protein